MSAGGRRSGPRAVPDRLAAVAAPAVLRGRTGPGGIGVLETKDPGPTRAARGPGGPDVVLHDHTPGRHQRVLIVTPRPQFNQTPVGGDEPRRWSRRNRPGPSTPPTPGAPRRPGLGPSPVPCETCWPTYTGPGPGGCRRSVTVAIRSHGIASAGEPLMPAGRTGPRPVDEHEGRAPAKPQPAAPTGVRRTAARRLAVGVRETCPHPDHATGAERTFRQLCGRGGPPTAPHDLFPMLPNREQRTLPGVGRGRFEGRPAMEAPATRRALRRRPRSRPGRRPRRWPSGDRHRIGTPPGGATRLGVMAACQRRALRPPPGRAAP